jgi:hypothetical protein
MDRLTISVVLCGSPARLARAQQAQQAEGVVCWPAGHNCVIPLAACARLLARCTGCSSTAGMTCRLLPVPVLIV